LDFGLAKSVHPGNDDDDASTLSLSDRIMSPEQAQGLEVDARSDLFSFGVLLYEMLSARSPFRGRSLFEILHRVTTDQQQPVRQLNPRVPQPLSDLVDRLLEKDPARRGEGAGAVAEVLASIAAHSPYSVETGAVEATEIWDRTRRTEAEKRPVVLRSWPSPELPAEPYPVLLPYTHPALLAGRDQEIAELRRLVRMPVPILGLCAPSGAGKSSLLVGGLVPALRASGATPVALVRHPHEPGIAGRLLGETQGASPPGSRGGPTHFSELKEKDGTSNMLEELLEGRHTIGCCGTTFLALRRRSIQPGRARCRPVSSDSRPSCS
ncbi:MAG: protein kinase, partial [bacterium]|nr:protein kinase [bacterium]